MKKPRICINCRHVGFWEDDPEVFMICNENNEPRKVDFFHYCDLFEPDDMEERLEDIRREGDALVEKLDGLLGGKS